MYTHKHTCAHVRTHRCMHPQAHMPAQGCIYSRPTGYSFPVKMFTPEVNYINPENLHFSGNIPCRSQKPSNFTKWFLTLKSSSSNADSPYLL